MSADPITLIELCCETCEEINSGGDDIEGCTDLEACNYNSEATLNDGSCLYDDDYGYCDGDNDGNGSCTAEFSDIYGTPDNYNTWTMLDPGIDSGSENQDAEILYNSTSNISSFEITINWCPENNLNEFGELICPEGSYVENAGVINFNQSLDINSWTCQILSNDSLENNGLDNTVISCNSPDNLNIYLLSGCGVLADLNFIGKIYTIEERFFDDSSGEIEGFSYDKCEGCSGSLDAEYPVDFSLSQNYPNPFNPITTIDFILENNEYIELSIYDIKGRIVNTLISDFYLSGSYSIHWDGTSSFGKSVSSGVYIYRLSTSDYILSNKMTLLR